MHDHKIEVSTLFSLEVSFFDLSIEFFIQNKIFELFKISKMKPVSSTTSLLPKTF